MKTVFNILTVAIFLAVTPNSCFAIWDVLTVTQEEAKKLGMEVRSKAAGPNHLGVELEFKVEGALKEYDGRFKDRSGVQLQLGTDDNLTVSAALREDRSKPGRVVVGFTTARAQLDQLTLTVSVPGSPGTVGGTYYKLPVKDFVELKKVR
jgi:hypothetical protein